MAKDQFIGEEEVWDKKKVLLGIVSILILLGIGVYFLKPYLFNQQNTAPQVHKKSEKVGEVAGINTEKKINQKNDNNPAPTSGTFSIPSAGDVQAKIATIQQQITHLDAAQIASSSPQVQKIIQDIQNLQEYPKNQAKEMCQQICSKF